MGNSKSKNQNIINKNDILVQHKKWQDSISIDKDNIRFNRNKTPFDSGNFFIHNENISLIWDKYLPESTIDEKIITININYDTINNYYNNFILNNIVFVNTNNPYNLYLINLVHRKDKRDKFLENIPQNLFNVNIFNAVKHVNGANGCSLSHLSLIKYAKNKNLPYIIVVEDDALFRFNSSKLKEILDLLISNLDKWEIFNGSPTFHFHEDIFNISSVYESFNSIFLDSEFCLSTSFIIYNANSYDKMLSFNFSSPIDLYITNNFIQTFYKEGPINVQDVSYSDIQNSNTGQDYSNMFIETYKMLDKKEIFPYINLTDRKIPKIVHFVFGLKEQTQEFNLVYALSILSAKEIINPDKIYFWYHYEPHGKWWDKVKNILELKKVNIPIYIGIKKIIKIAHKADIIRMEKLLEYGGIYLDIDTVTVKSIDHLLNEDFVICKEKNYGLCNAIMMSKKNSKFLKEWWDNYEKVFKSDGWNEASIIYPYKLSKTNKNLRILSEEMCLIPSFKEVNKIFLLNTTKISDKLLILHLWESYSSKYYKFNDINDIVKGKNLYAKIISQLTVNTNILEYLI